MARLLLAKHSMPHVQPELPSGEWTLSGEGVQRCGWLAARFREHDVRQLYCSTEPKAAETARLAGQLLGLEPIARPEFRENDRTNLGFLDGAALRRRIQDFFGRPSEYVMGLESAQDALARFSSAVKIALAEARGANTAIVAHGAVITLFVAAHNTIPQFPFWEHMGLPSFVALDAEGFAFDGKIHNFAG